MSHFPRTIATAVLALAVGLVPLASAPVALADSGEYTGHHSHHDPSPAVQGVTPTITGDAVLGATLTAVAGAWSPEGVTLTYQWYRGERRIADATSDTYLLTDSDVGRRIRVKVTGAADGLRSTRRVSPPTDRVTAPALTAAVPTVTGTAQVGSVLTADAGAWGPDGVVLTYQWYRGHHRIKGANASTYTLVARDQRHVIRVRVTGTLAGYATTSLVSAPTGKVVGGTLTSTPVPTISGIASVGAELTVDPGIWGPGDVHLSYQWFRSGERIRHAHGATYVVRAQDQGTTLTVVVTGRECGFEPVSMTSDGVVVGDVG